MCRCKHWHSVVLAVIISLATVRLVSCRSSKVTIQQGGPVSLLEALQDSNVATIALASDYSVAADVPTSLPAPVLLQRNVTIVGVSDAGAPITLDLAFRRAAVLLCPTCTVTLRNLTLRNARRGSGVAVDFVVGDEHRQSAAVLLEGVYRHRLACTPASDTAEVLSNTPRSAVLPPSATGKQSFTIETVTRQGVTYPDSLHLIDVTQDLPLAHQEGRGHSAMAHWGGYALGSREVVYLCDNIVSEACLAEKQPDACVNELIDSILAQKTKPGLSGTLLAAIIVPVVVVGAIATALVVWALRRRRRRQQLQQRRSDGLGKLQFTEPERDCFEGSFSHSNGRMGPIVPPPGSSVNLDSASDMHSMYSKSQGGRRSLEVAMQPSGRQEGWQLVSSATAACVVPPVGAEADVEFGSFLGAGSYGRVYRARWAGRGVACKVIQHDRSTLAAVTAEADLMLAVDHENVVKALHYSTFTYTEQANSDRGPSRNGRTWSQGVGATGQRQSSAGSQSSGGSSAAVQRRMSMGEGAQQLNRASFSLPPPSSNSNSGSGCIARMTLQQQLQQQQQPEALVVRQESHDVLVTNLSLDAEAGQEAAAVAVSLSAISSAVTKDSSGTTAKEGQQGSRNSGDGITSDTGSAVKHKAETWLVQEFCDLGTLGGIAGSWDMSDECDEQMLERLQLLKDTALGLEELHNNHVVHGDVNARNVLVSSSNKSPTGMCAKVADLGLARCLAHHATHRTTNSCGTMSHMAPELLRYGRLSPGVDIYAFGIMMWELYHGGQAAFEKLHYGQFFETVVLRKIRPYVPAGMPPDYELLMRQCWAAEPAERPSVAVLVRALQLMVDSRQQRLQAAAATLAAAAGGDPSASSAHQQAAAAVQPAGVDVLPALQALLPVKVRGPSPAGPPTPLGATQQAAGAAGSSIVSPGNSGTPLSNVSLSTLFVDNTPDPPTETVLVIGDGAARVGPAAAAHGHPTRAAAATAGRGGGCPPAAATPAGSPLSGDLENQVLDQSVHNNRLWFV